MTLSLMRRVAVCCAVGVLSLGAIARGEDKPVRVGLIGIDNYQVVEYTNFFHNPDYQARFFEDDKSKVDAYRGLEVVAAWKGGSKDLADSQANIDRWTVQLNPHLQDKKRKPVAGAKERPTVEFFEDPQEVIKRSDVIMVMSTDAQQHLEQALWAIKAGKPVFIGRPLAASLTDAVRIVQAAEAAQVPIFSCSQHRFVPGFIGMKNHPEVGNVLGVDVYGGSDRGPKHPDLTWQAVHGVEVLFTLLGPGCESVTRTTTDLADVVTGKWKDGRVGVYRGIRTGKKHPGSVKWSGVVFGDKGVSVMGVYGHGVPSHGVVPKNDHYMGYLPLGGEIGKFFKSKKSPMTNAELLEVYSFLEAAEESHRQHGAPVTLESVLKKAQAEVAAHPQK